MTDRPALKTIDRAKAGKPERLREIAREALDRIGAAE